MKYNKEKKRNILFIWLSLLMCVVSMVGSSTIISNFGKTKVTETKFVSESGYILSGIIYRPISATKENPAPTILVQHGGNDSKEDVRRYCIELSRRGYVAMAVDMYSHGSSEALPDSEWLTAGRGLYDALRYAIKLPFVDVDRVGIIGYSRGGKAAGESMDIDNDNGKIIKAIYLVHSDPTYKNADGQYTDIYGPRHVGVLADTYDEYFFTEKLIDTQVYSNDTNKYASNLSSPTEYLKNKSAQSFLNFGVDPTNLTLREAEIVYEKDFDGDIGTRVINSYEGIHNSTWWSYKAVNQSLEFFSRVMPGLINLSTTDYIFPFAEFFLTLGMLGTYIFIIVISVYFVKWSKVFEGLYYGEPVLRKVTDKTAIYWFWVLQVVNTVVSILMILMANKLGLNSFHDTIFRSGNPLYFGLLCLIGGAFTLFTNVIWYHYYGKSHGFSFEEVKLFIKGNHILKTAYVAIAVVFVGYSLSFFAKYLFNTDFRIAYWGFKPFAANRIIHMLLVLPMYVVFYTVMSINVNCFGFNSLSGKSKLVNALVQSFLAATSTLLIIIYCYGYFKITGWNPMLGGLASAGNAVFPLPLTVFINMFVCRKIFEKTGNAYLGGFVSGLIATIVSWSTCEIRIPEVDELFKINWGLTGMIALGFAVIIFSTLYFRKNAKITEVDTLIRTEGQD